MFDRTLPPLWLERMGLGEREIPKEAGVEEQLQALRSSDAQILAQYPPDVMAPGIRRLAARRQVPSRRTATISAVAALAMLFLFFYEPAEETRMKGAPTHPITVYRKTGGISERLAPNALAKAGDQIQLSYYVTEPLYGMLFSVDGVRKITLHYPQDASTSPLLTAGREMQLTHGFELDGSPGFEKFILVTSPTPFDVSEVLSKAAADLPLIQSTETFLLTK